MALGGLDGWHSGVAIRHLGAAGETAELHVFTGFLGLEPCSWVAWRDGFAFAPSLALQRRIVPGRDPHPRGGPRCPALGNGEPCRAPGADTAEAVAAQVDHLASGSFGDALMGTTARRLPAGASGLDCLRATVSSLDPRYRGQLVEVLAPARLAAFPFLRPDGVVAVLTDHLRGRRDNSTLLGRLVALSLWAEIRAQA